MAILCLEKNPLIPESESIGKFDWAMMIIACFFCLLLHVVILSKQDKYHFYLGMFHFYVLSLGPAFIFILLRKFLSFFYLGCFLAYVVQIFHSDHRSILLVVRRHINTSPCYFSYAFCNSVTYNIYISQH